MVHNALSVMSDFSRLERAKVGITGRVWSCNPQLGNGRVTPMSRSAIRALMALMISVLAIGLTGVASPASAADDVLSVTTETNASSTGTSDENSAPTRSNSVTTKKAFTSRSRNAITAVRALAPHSYVGYYRTAKYAQWYAKRHVKAKYGWNDKQFGCLKRLWQKESSWRMRASGAHGKFLGIPQLSKKAIVAAGMGVALFRSTPELQVQMGARYIKYRDAYGTPCKALKHKKRTGWY